MAKKIYDIKPPKTAEKKIAPVTARKSKPRVKKQPVVSSVVETPVVTQQVAPVIEQKNPVPVVNYLQENRSNRKPILIGSLVVILAVAGYLFFKLPKADVTLWPKVETLTFQQTITADKAIESVDVVNAIVPAKYFQATKTIAQDFPATGNASDEGKASGKITIYNKYDPPTPFTFKAGTHFMSDSGKLFISPSKIIIPAAKKVGSKITPGTVDVIIQAVEGGTDYNIAPSNFSVTGLKGTAFYYSVYASSKSDMTGGYAGKVKKVTDDDIQEAKNVLTEKATTDAMTEVKNQISSEYILLDNASLSNTTEASTQTKSGTIADNFNYSVTVQASALAFKKADVDKLVNNYILSKAPLGKTILENSSKIDYSSNVIDISGGKATLNLSFSAGVYQDIDKNAVALSLLGENAEKIKQTISNNLGDQISNIQVKFWPFWVNSAPNSQKAVNIFLKFQ